MKNITDYLEKEQVDQVLAAAHQCSTRNTSCSGCCGAPAYGSTSCSPSRRATSNPVTAWSTSRRRKGGSSGGCIGRSNDQNALRIRFCTTTPRDRPVFALKQRQVRNIVKRYGSVIEKTVRPHTFRHSSAIHCVRNGWDIRRLQQVLGHSSLNVTAVYLQFNDQDIKELYDSTPF